MQQFKTLSMCVIFTLLSGCATLSKEECMTGNWEAIGYGDGAAGRSAQRISEHNKACAKVGVAPDYQAWRKGREQGLTQYCTANNAYQMGLRGQPLNAVCVGSNMLKLDEMNQAGLQYYGLTKQLKQEQNQLNRYISDYEKLRQGSHLDFKTERDARSYFIQLPKKIGETKTRISRLEDALSRY